jgi:predicted CoA-binding protein
MSTPHVRLHFRMPLLILTIFTALGAISGGLGLLFAPDGHLLGWSPSMLATTPFHDYFIPGLMLLVVIGGGHALAAAGLIARRRVGLVSAAIAGAALTLWIVTQLALIGFFWLQALMLAIGLVEVALALLAWRAVPPAIAPEVTRVAERFMILGRAAFVGLSREPNAFSRQIAEAMKRRGIDVVGVNPKASPAEDMFAHLSDVPDLYRRFVFVLVPPSQSLEVVREAIAAGVRHLWFHQGAGPGSATPEAIAAARAAGLMVVEGLCPFMVLEPHHWMHGLHRDLRLGALGRSRGATSS